MAVANNVIIDHRIHTRQFDIILACKVLLLEWDRKSFIPPSAPLIGQDGIKLTAYSVKVETTQ